MAKLFTEKYAVEYIKLMYNLTPPEKYKNSTSKWKCITEDGYIIYIYFSTMHRKKVKRLMIFDPKNPYTIKNIERYIEINQLEFKLKNGQRYVNCDEKLIWICPIHGEFKKSWDNFKQGFYCHYCTNTCEIWDGNRFSSQRPDLVKYFKYPEDADNITTNNSKFELQLVCPNCKTEKIMNANWLNHFGFNCVNCSDGISYPEMVIRELLFYLNIEFYPHKKI